MEPRVFTRGNLYGPEGKITKSALASMEPRVFTRGNSLRDELTRVKADVLQWSHASSRVETPAPEPPGRPAPALQWSHASSRVETCAHAELSGCQSVCFNGATRLHAWKH